MKMNGQSSKIMQIVFLQSFTKITEEALRKVS